jgi:hypothetical protein
MLFSRVVTVINSRSQWPRGLRHEMSSPAWTLGSWVRIPLEAWMFVYVYSVFVLSCVGSGLAKGWSPVQGVLPIVLIKRRPRPEMGCSAIWEEEEPLISSNINTSCGNANKTVLGITTLIMVCVTISGNMLLWQVLSECLRWRKVKLSPHLINYVPSHEDVWGSGV